jgi:[protein-PII] uridylyltransferase
MARVRKYKQLSSEQHFCDLVVVKVVPRQILAQRLHSALLGVCNIVSAMSTVALNPGKESCVKQDNRQVSETVRQSLHSWIKWHAPPGIDAEEIEAHFQAMPARYWERVNEGELLWGLETIHKFLKLVSEPNSPAVSPVLAHLPDGRCTKVMICTWDRHGLLAKAAAAFSAVRINVLQADVFTRADNIVLDVFRICEAKPNFPITEGRLEEMLFLLEGALSEPPRFASFWASLGHRVLPETQSQSQKPVLAFDTASSPDHTILRVEAGDRLGLLSDILASLADSNVNIDQALIDTRDGKAIDLFCLRDTHHGKIVDPARLDLIRQRLLEAITG